MKRFIYIAMTSATALLLSGCPWPRSNLGCDANFVQGSKWNLMGLEIPFNSKYLGTVKIGKVDYTGAQAEQISDAIRALDQARQGNCSLTTSSQFHLLSPNARDAIFLNASNGYNAILNFGMALKNAATPADGQAALDKAKATAIEVVVPTAPPKSSLNADTDSTVATSEIQKTIRDLRADVTFLSQGLEEVRKTGARRITVSGFAPDGASLLASQRTFVMAQITQAMAVVPPNRTPNVLLIGYADGKGAKTYNADLALRRAANVAEFLRRQDFGRNFHTEVTSGGVFSQGEGETARRVDILVSRVAVLVLNA